jgi:hypothetical protein
MTQEIGTRDQFNNQSTETFCGKKGLQDANANHTRDTFPCLLAVPHGNTIIHLSNSFSAQHAHPYGENQATTKLLINC